MKKLILLIAITVFWYSNADAQINIKDIKKGKTLEAVVKNEKHAGEQELRKLIGTEVSHKSEQQFGRDFSNIPVVKWERSVYFDEATFTKDTADITAYYDSDSRLVGTLAQKNFADLPAKARKEIQTKYKDHSPTVSFFEDNKLNATNMVLYNTQFDDADNYFIEAKKNNERIILRVDANGNVYPLTTIK